MARENKRVRDAWRFGTPARMADRFWTLPLALPGVVDGRDQDNWTKVFTRIRDQIADSIMVKVVDASNVFAYVDTMGGSGKLKYDAMIVNAAPPFPECFIEADIPADLSPQVKQIGWSLRAYEKGSEPELAYTALLSFPNPGMYEHCRWIIVGSMAMACLSVPGKRDMGLMITAIDAVVFLDSHGQSLAPPFMSIPEFWLGNEDEEWIKNWAQSSFFSCMLAFCFMNCKNVTTEACEPGAAINRERRKAGLKPFLRYHTINIEPMKAVLKHEGGIETNGLKKSLHICRGHFATYSPDKPLFGHFTGTVWKPSHVRGSAKQGVVVSDYKIGAPTPPSSTTTP